MRSLRDPILQHFPDASPAGAGDSEVTGSLQRFGANRLTPLPREPVWKKFLGKFDDAIIKILLAATLLKTVVDLLSTSSLWGGVGLGLTAVVLILLPILKWSEWVPAAMFGLAVALVGVSVGIGQPSWEGLAVMLAVVLATGVAFLSEHQSDREFEALNAHKESLRVRLLRAGEVRTVPLEEVVVGDLVALEMGDEVPADGRLIKANELHIDQSLLTGESEPVRKQVRPDDESAEGPENPGCLYRGTQVVDGAGQMTVTEVGDLTMLGQIARRLSADVDDAEDAGQETSEKRVQNKLTISKAQTPLQQKLTRLAGLISKVGYAAAIAIFCVLLGRGLFVGEVKFSAEAADLRQSIGNLLAIRN